MGDNETGLVARATTRAVAPAIWDGDAHAREAITRAGEYSAAIVTPEDLVSEVGW